MPSWIQGAPGWLAVKLFVQTIVRSELKANVKVLFVEHHLSHAASAFFPSPFEEAAVLTIDGVGEWATTTLGTANREKVQILEEIHFPHSLGLLYSTFTQYCGFKVNSGEYKLMGLAPYGTPIYADRIRTKLIDLKDDGSFDLASTHGFCYLISLRCLTLSSMNFLGARPPTRKSNHPAKKWTSRLRFRWSPKRNHKNCAHLRDLTRLANLCMAGGVALDCVTEMENFCEKRSSIEFVFQPAGRRCRRRSRSSFTRCARLFQSTSAAGVSQAGRPEG